MSQVKMVSFCALTLCMLMPFASIGSAQPPKKNADSVDINKNPRKVKEERRNAFKKFIDEEGKYIATEAEMNAFKLLKTDEERENFIDYFWRMRDPNPDTEENEYREAYFERVAYANEHFASGMPGWKTDRGRIYITWGKPDEIETHPSGGSYDRPSYEGRGSTTTYPFETWFYRHLDNVGDGIEIEFVDPTGTGEYRMARDANEKDALKNIPGAGNTLAEQLNLQTRADRLSGGEQSYMRQQDMPFERMRIQTGLFTPPNVKYTDLERIARGDSPVVDTNPVDFDLRIDFFRQSENQVVTTFTIQTPNKELQFKDSGGLQVASINVFGRITAVSDKRSGIFEDAVSQNATTDELNDIKNNRQSIYQNAIALKPGIYKVDVVVRDVNSGTSGQRSLGFTVPKYDERKLSTSSLVLTSSLRTTNQRDIGQRFVIGSLKVVPNLAGIYKQGKPVGVYLQIYNAEIDQTNLRPAVDVEYILTSGGKEVLRQKEDWSGLSDSGQRLTLARLLPTDKLPAGDYEIKVVTKDRVRTDSQLIENRGKFTITQ